MPTHTPSPHRFLAPPSTARKSKPQSNLRHGYIAHSQAKTPKPVISERNVETPRGTPARRFIFAPGNKGGVAIPGASTARDGIRGSNPEGEETWNHGQGTPTHHTPLSRPRAGLVLKLERIESIEEGGDSSPEKIVHHRQDQDVDSSLESEDASMNRGDMGTQDIKAEEDEDHDLLFTPGNVPQPHHPQAKRRRLSTPIPSRPSSSHTTPTRLSRPRTRERTTPTTESIPSVPSHRFIIPPIRSRPQTPAGDTQNQLHHTNRPAFRLPQPTSPSKDLHPLPNTFSPQRRNQKYVPGGMASEVARWIIEAAGSEFGGRGRQPYGHGREREEGVRLRVRLGDVRAGYGAEPHSEAAEAGIEGFVGGVVFAKEETDRGRSRGVVLIGQAGRGTSEKRVRKGSTVGVRAPCWDVDVRGEKWVVGVDWIVLGS